MKKKVIGALSGVGAVLVSSGVMAADPGTANQAVVSAMTTAANDMTATGSAVLAVALPLLALAFVVRYGIKLFRVGSGTRG